MLPGSIAGICIDWLLASVVTADMVCFIVGANRYHLRDSLCLHQLLLRQQPQIGTEQGICSFLGGSIVGYTSFGTHCGDRPFQVYNIPLRLAS